MQRLLLLFFLLTSLLVSVKLVQVGWQFLFAEEVTTFDVRLSNLTDNSVTLTWRSTTATEPSLVAYGDTLNLGRIAKDDRTATTSQKRFTHIVTLRNLTPSTTYYYRLSPNTPVNSFTTGPTTSSPPSPIAAFGNTSFTNIPPNDDLFLLLKILTNDGRESNFISTLVDENGNYGINLGNIRTQDNQDLFDFSIEQDKILFIAWGKDKYQAIEKHPASPHEPLPQLVLSVIGDINRDGLVNGADASILVTYWQQTEFEPKVDLNLDTMISGYDASIMMSNWTR